MNRNGVISGTGMKQADMKEEDIRPERFKHDQRLYLLKDIDNLLSMHEDFIEVPCPACSSFSHEQPFKKNGFTYVFCGACETLYMNPRPSPAVLESFYKTSENYAYWNKYIFPATEEVRRERIFVPRVDRTLELCRKYQSELKSLLEVGAAFGTFCSEMASRNVFERIVAVEPTPDLANTCRRKGIETIEKPIEMVSFAEEDKFDVIASFEVIEHLFSPGDFIIHCRKLLKVNGLLILTCPNNKGFDFVVLGTQCESIDHEHLNYYNPKSLALLLKSHGFNILEVQTPGKLDAELVRKKILSGEYDASKQPFLKQLLIDQWETAGDPFQRFLSENLLSSHMWVAATPA
jgi:2-polyprenyl-3-methyl-5-hydroxy-6-metoxy-1,4-benzoquinol methylase